MIAVGMVMAWAGWSVGLYGWCLVRGYNVTFWQLANPLHPYGSVAAQKWPPPPAGNLQIFPDGGKGGAATTAVQVVGSAGGGSAGLGSAGPVTFSRSLAANRKVINAEAKRFGWGSGQQWAALTQLIASESGGDSLIANPSGAFGIGQALGHGTACSAASNVHYTVSGGVGPRVGTVNQYGPQYGLSCADARRANAGDVVQQMRWTLGYIRSRYGTPAAAWAFHRANNWY